MIPLDDIFSLDGKTVLVIGGRGYLGRRFCGVLAEAGATVISADLSGTSPAAQKGDTETSDAVTQKDVDVTDSASVQSLVDEIGTVDVLVYAATAKPKDFYAPYTECSLEGWKTVLAAELDGAFLVTQAVGKIMEKQHSGSIIFLSSIYGLVGNDQRIYEGVKNIYFHNEKFSSPVSYAISKAGVVQLTKYLASYYREKNIRVNCLTPGGVFDDQDDNFNKEYSYRTTLGRMADKNEYNGAILFLCSDASNYMSGANLIVDGGWTAV